MNNNLEIEYKILLTEEQFNQLLNCYPQQTFITQTNTYYDTEHFDLRNQKCAMRIREREKKFLYTLKIPAQSGHMEYEIYVNENSIQALNTPEIQQLMQQLNIHERIVPIATCTTHRAVIVLDQAELCFDINDYNGFRDYEVEYECTQPHDGITKFNEILSQIGIQYSTNCKSKIARTLESQ